MKLWNFQTLLINTCISCSSTTNAKKNVWPLLFHSLFPGHHSIICMQTISNQHGHISDCVCKSMNTTYVYVLRYVLVHDMFHTYILLGPYFFLFRWQNWKTSHGGCYIFLFISYVSKVPWRLNKINVLSDCCFQSKERNCPIMASAKINKIKKFQNIQTCLLHIFNWNLNCQIHQI